MRSPVTEKRPGILHVPLAAPELFRKMGVAHSDQHFGPALGVLPALVAALIDPAEALREEG